MQDTILHARKPLARQTLCGLPTRTINDQLLTIKQFTDRQTWDLTHSGVRLCLACTRKLQQEN